MKAVPAVVVTVCRISLYWLQVVEAQTQLKSAVSKSHPPTAKYLVETAAVCIDIGLLASEHGLTLRPVAWSLVADAVYKACPHVADLLEKLCGKTGQKYFQLLGNSESGEPEFVGANLAALIIPKQLSPAVSSILDQIYHRVQPEQGDRSAICAKLTLHGESLLDDGKGLAGEPSMETASAGQVHNGEADGLLPVINVPKQALSRDTAGGVQTVQRPTVVYNPVASTETSASPQSSGAGSTPAMQALLSACMQVPDTSASHSQTSSAQPKSVSALPSVPATRPASASVAASLPAAALATRPASAAPVPIKTQSVNGTGIEEATATNGIGGVQDGTPGSSPSSSASGITQAMQVALILCLKSTHTSRCKPYGGTAT